MRRLNLIFGFLIAEIALLWLFVILFVRLDESHVVLLLVGFGLVQLGLLATGMWVAERERDRGKSRQRLARERSQRERTLGLWTAGVIYLARLSVGIWRLAQGGWSGKLFTELALWTVFAGALFYFLHLRPSWNRSGMVPSEETVHKANGS
jgi:hypothetical protein